ncbi:hypothetical protein [Polaribacter porphyrae]|uniref:Beta-carotene 15,15'-monooxygenase n=1 Tax=Polaribacter porphyrae TaxID=1137780 RepID=A0A2S7WLN6_9FLAO|nr:hypothetical protein [Polaribacter porphyrae]PQJ78525.1 hypothetical protein BTO18_04685 [Polaribacter porphyrae]
MDVLENYKKAWSKQTEVAEKVSTNEIYKMAHSKSSSIVKWIFIVGILEFIFWITINIFTPDSYSFFEIYKDLNLETLINIFTILHYIVIIGFLYLFYKNYTKISIADNTKKLIHKILRIRKTVRNYVYYNLAIIVLTSIIINIVVFSDEDKMNKFFNPENLTMSINEMITLSVISQLIALVIILALFWLFYKLVYGILLKKLNRNYKELIKLDS